MVAPGGCPNAGCASARHQRVQSVGRLVAINETFDLLATGTLPSIRRAGDSVAGQPSRESGDVQEGAQGPNAVPEDETGTHPHKP